MRRAFIAAAIIISFALTSCITGGNTFSAESGGSLFLDALSSSPTRARAEERPIEEVLAPAAKEEEETLPEVLPSAVFEEADDSVPEDEAEDTEPDVVFVPAVVYSGIDGDAIPPSEDVAAVEPAFPAKEAEADVAVAAPEPRVIVVEKEREEELMHYSIDGWMLRLMVVSIVSVILFTAATAIRSGAKRALPRVAAVLLSAAFTAIPWIATAAIAGGSPLWCIYLILLLTYIIFRSENRKRGSR